MILVYVDDCLIFSKDQKLTEETYQSLKKDFDLTDEGSIDKYLGIDIKRQKNGTIHLTQPNLQNRIVESIPGISNSNPKYTPAIAKELLHKDVEGQVRKNNWNYRSVVGMLNYLASSTRPDIQFAVHQCARFCNDPKLSHEQACKHICKYIRVTATEGLIYKPDKLKGLECYVDADFAGGWSKDNGDEPSSVFSRTGYVIKYCNCPIVWLSKLQTEIALSTTEAEYIALSQSMREVIPMMQIMEEIHDYMGIPLKKPIVKCTVFEDNNGALELAKTPKMRPRTKHIALKYHHFRSFVTQGKIDVLPIDTSQQIADIFTKPLSRDLFERLRHMLNGW